MGITVNGSLASSNSRTLPIMLINPNSYNVWLRQPLLVAELYDTECYPWEYKAVKDQEW